MSTITPHLSWAEVLRGSGVRTQKDLPRDIQANVVATALTMFEPIREEFGEPLDVVSGYRTPEANAAADGKKRSQHMAGRALDLVPSAGPAGCLRLYDLAAAMQKAGSIPKGGLCLYLNEQGQPRFVHVDCRGTRSRWDQLDAATGRWVTRRKQGVA